MVVGVLHIELHVPAAASLKDTRSVLKSIKDQLHGRLNLAVADVDPNEKWQRATLGAVTVGRDRRTVESCVQHVRTWIGGHPIVQLIRIEQEMW